MILTQPFGAYYPVRISDSCKATLCVVVVILKSYSPVQTLCCCCALSPDHTIQSDLAGFLPQQLG